MTQRPRLLVLQSNPSFLGFLKLLDDFDISVVDLNTNRLFRVPKGTGITVLAKQAKWAILHRAGIRRLCKRFDIIFCDFLRADVATVSRLTRTPIVVRLHRYEIDRPDLITQVDWNRVAKLVVVSEEYRRLAEAIIKSPATVIYNGIDLDRFVFTPAAGGAICTYGHHVGRKRLYDLMLALRNYELHIGGEGEDDRMLKEANTRFGLRHRLYGSVPIPEWLRDKEYFITHSMDDSFQVALIEAMATGLLCLCHDYAAAKEIIPDEYRYRYDSELIERLEHFRGLSAHDRQRRKIALRRIVEQRFDVRSQSEMFRALFNDAMS
jgi:glycosyltransferase involved in cell wall biosynthesis